LDGAGAHPIGAHASTIGALDVDGRWMNPVWIFEFVDKWAGPRGAIPVR
jgi:hypothetical protein